MIIPISTQDIKIGDVVTNIKIIDYKWYIIPSGHDFIVIGYDEKYACFICKDSDTNLKVKMYKTEMTKKVNIKLAKKEYTLRVETIEYREFILNNCPNKTEGYEDRDSYNACILKGYPYGYCEPELKCSKYLSPEDINRSTVLLRHLRKNKIYKLNENDD